MQTYLQSFMVLSYAVPELWPGIIKTYSRTDGQGGDNVRRSVSAI